MTEEVQALAEVDSAPAPEVTATPEAIENAPEVADESKEQPEEKKYSQAEIDAMIGKRLAREQRKWEREQAQAGDWERASLWWRLARSVNCFGMLSSEKFLGRIRLIMVL